jgi:hypothetical protein
LIFYTENEGKRNENVTFKLVDIEWMIKKRNTLCYYHFDKYI